MSAADTATAVDRETAWLTTTGDGLPALLTSAGGPWDVIQAYATRTPAQRQSQIYVLRRGFATDRWSQQRRMPSYRMHLACLWPVGGTTTGTGIAEDEQRAFDNALALLVQRIEAFVGDKSHGGRFLNVADAEAGPGSRVDVTFDDPVQTITNGAYLSAQVTYTANDTDYVM
ncbi:MAG: hypothetical protein HOW97_12245 [Catenulispora sp.]|nr:hypothetical protein [Catenulispora sp.]